MTRRISAVAACCSSASALSLSASARRFSRSPTLPPSRLGAVRDGLPLGFAFAGFVRRGIGLSLPLVVQRPMTGYANGPPWTRGTVASVFASALRCWGGLPPEGLLLLAEPLLAHPPWPMLARAITSAVSGRRSRSP